MGQHQPWRASGKGVWWRCWDTNTRVDPYIDTQTHPESLCYLFLPSNGKLSPCVLPWVFFILAQASFQLLLKQARNFRCRKPDWNCWFLVTSSPRVRLPQDKDGVTMFLHIPHCPVFADFCVWLASSHYQHWEELSEAPMSSASRFLQSNC